MFRVAASTFYLAGLIGLAAAPFDTEAACCAGTISLLSGLVAYWTRPQWT